MTIQQLMGFVSVADTRNYTYSAQQLYITQPALSNQIKSLENELGCSLFVRSTKAVELTAEGKAFLPEARYILGHYDRARTRLYHLRKQQNRTLRMGYAANHELRAILPLIQSLRREHPDLQLELKSVSLPILLNALRDRELDLVVTYQLEGIEQQDLQFRALYTIGAEQRLMLAVPADHPLADVSAVTLADLPPHEDFWVDDGLHVDVFAFQERAAIDENGVTVRRCPTLQDALSLCEAGLGVTMLPDTAIPQGLNLHYIPMEQMPVGIMGFYYLQEPEGLLHDLVALTESNSQSDSLS